MKKKEIAHRLRLLRIRSGLNMTEIAHSVGVTQPGWKKWENGDCLPSSEYLLMIFDLYGVEPNCILLGCIDEKKCNDFRRGTKLSVCTK